MTSYTHLFTWWFLQINSYDVNVIRKQPFVKNTKSKANHLIIILDAKFKWLCLWLNVCIVKIIFRTSHKGAGYNVGGSKSGIKRFFHINDKHSNPVMCEQGFQFRYRELCRSMSELFNVDIWSIYIYFFICVYRMILVTFSADAMVLSRVSRLSCKHKYTCTCVYTCTCMCVHAIIHIVCVFFYVDMFYPWSLIIWVK